ncbi:DUF4240 domain-containing protein [Streptomyces sp. NPDC057680]|uniref:DUF4240 domain-containing protein n=1 Tax=Streptomyces sp. NPDC057680 TaxID=3346208 RepID=UPI003693A4E8
MACSAPDNKQHFWQLIEAARDRASNPNDGEAVAREATSLLASRAVEEIVAVERALRGLMVDSYTNPLWAAAYIANGGCSDDGFDYFRGWRLHNDRAERRIRLRRDRELCAPFLRCIRQQGVRRPGGLGGRREGVEQVPLCARPHMNPVVGAAARPQPCPPSQASAPPTQCD